VAVMSPGRIEQLGTPPEVYARPATEFVASFIGRGNLLAGVATAVGEGVRVQLLPEGPEVRVQAERDYRLGQEVKLLIRPERIRVGGSLENKLCGRLKGMEFLGDALWAYLNFNRNELRVKLPALNPEFAEGQELKLSFSSEDCHLLPASGESQV